MLSNVSCIVIAAARNSSKLIDTLCCSSGGIAQRHANPSVLYPPIPCSHASEYVVAVGEVKVMLLMSMPLVEMEFRMVIQRRMSSVSLWFIFCVPWLQRRWRERSRLIKYRAWGTIWAAWLRRPMMRSMVLLFTLPICKMVWRSAVHCFAFPVGRYIRNVRVSSPHPRHDFSSSGVPSPSNLRMLVASSRGRGSDG